MGKTNKTGAFLGGMLLGSAIGAIVGMVAAPRSGKETRRILKKTAKALPELAEDLSSTMQLQAYRLSESALSNWDDTLERLKEALAAGIEASEQEAKHISQVTETTSKPNSADNL